MVTKTTTINPRQPKGASVVSSCIRGLFPFLQPWSDDLGTYSFIPGYLLEAVGAHFWLESMGFGTQVYRLRIAL